MAASWPFDRWSEILSLPAAAAEAIGVPFAGALRPGALLADPFAPVIEALRPWLIGKTRTLRVNGRELTLVVEDFIVTGPDLARSLGQYGEIRIIARDVAWADGQIERLDIRARNVHLRPAALPTLVAAPVLWEALVPAASAAGWLAAAAPALELTFDGGVPCLGLAGRASWPRLEIEAAADGRSVRIRPRALRLGGRRLPLHLPRWLPSHHVSPGALPRGAVLTEIEPASTGVLVRGLLPEWNRAPSRRDIERLLAALRAGTGPIDV